MRDLRHIQQYLTSGIVPTAANVVIGSGLDYCNSLLWGLSATDLHNLQCVQNCLVTIASRATKYSHMLLLWERLSTGSLWNNTAFPKTALLLYKFLHTGCHEYFSQNQEVCYNTCASQSDSVVLEIPPFVPSVHKSIRHFGLTFACDAPKIRNDFPDVRSASSVNTLRKTLKAYLFSKAYPPLIFHNIMVLFVMLKWLWKWFYFWFNWIWYVAPYSLSFDID